MRGEEAAAVTAICPHCGYDLERDERIEIDGFVFDPLGLLGYGEKELRLPPAPFRLLFTLAKAKGRAMHLDALQARVSGEDATSNVARVHLTRLRNAFKRFAVPYPVQNIKGTGLYRWRVA